MSERPATVVIFTRTAPVHFNDAPLVVFSKSLPDVKAVWMAAELPMSDVKLMARKINEQGVTRIVLAGEQPGLDKAYFTGAMAAAGQNPAAVVLAGFREQGILSDAGLAMAQAVVYCAVKGVPFERAAQPKQVPVNPDTLVIGAGIAGIQAALEIAGGGQTVYLVEKTGTIGGHMAMFDKTFPTLDCAACILTPKMVEVGQNARIILMTYSEVKALSGTPGHYTVKILKKARRVNVSTCIGCGMCAEKCPARAKSEFDAGTTLRKAIYIPFPQAVPNKYLIDAASCIYVQKSKCGVCAKVCPVPGCINLDEKDQEVDITVGNIVVATGFKPFDAARAEQFGYGKFPNVLTSLEMERLVNASGPTDGGIHFRSKDKKDNWVFAAAAGQPKSLALIHCVGSRDENFNKYCSKVCCMYSLKLAHLIKEKLPDAAVVEYYIDMRAFGKGYEEFYERIKEEGVKVVRGRTAKVTERNGKLLLRTEDILGDRLDEREFDMVVLAVGLEPREDSEALARMLGISRSEEGWFMEAHADGEPVGTFTGGVAIAGVCQGPKDIPDTVAQASAAAARVLQSIIKGSIGGSVKDLSLQEIQATANQLVEAES